MSAGYRPVSDDWTADQWEAARARAAAFLALPVDVRGPWVVGPDVVLMYERGAAAARAREATCPP